MDLPMQDETSRTPANEEDRAQRGVLWLLLAPDTQAMWSVAEVAREVGGALATADALASLEGAGLLHRCGEFVFATRAARYMDRLSV
jgi:hypothetical protein